MKKIFFLVSIIAVLLLMTIVIAVNDPNGVPFWLESIVNKLNEILTAIQNLQLNPTVNVYPNYTPNVNVENNVPVPEVNVNNEVPVPSVINEINIPTPNVTIESPTINLENTIPVPNVTVNNQVQTPSVSVNNNVPVPNVTVNNEITVSQPTKECNVETATERIDEFTSYMGDYVFTLPKFPYKKGTFNAINGVIEFNCKGGPPEYNINDNFVCSKAVSEGDHEICNINPTFFKEGINILKVNGNCIGYWIAVQYNYTPANC